MCTRWYIVLTQGLLSCVHVGIQQGSVRSILTQLVMCAEWEGKEQLGLYLPSWSCVPNGRARSSQVYTYLAGHVCRMGEQGAVRSILTQLVMCAEWESKEQLGLYLPSWSCGPNGRARSSQVYTYLAGHVDRMGEQGAVRSILTQLVMCAEWESKEQLGLYLPSWSCGPNGRARSSQVYTYLAGHVGRMGEQGAVRSILTQLVMWAEWESKEQLGLYLPSWSCGPNGRARISQVYTYLAGHVGRMGEQGAVRSILTQLVMWAEWESKEQLGLYLPSWSCVPNGRARSSQVYTYLAGHVGRMGEQGAVRSILTQLVMWAEWESKEQLGLYLPSWSCGPNGRARSSQVYTYLAGHVGRMGEQGAVRSILTQLVMWAEWESKEQLGLYLPSWSCGRMGEQGAVRSILTQLVMWAEWESKEQLGLYLPSWSCGPNGRARSSQVYTYLAGHVGRMGEQGAVRSILTQLVMWAEWESKEQLGLYLPTYLAGHVGRMGEQGAVRSILTQLVMWAEWESKEQLGLYLPSWSCGPNGRARSSQVYTYLAGHVGRMGEQGAVRSILTQLVMWAEWESKEQLGLYLPSWSCGPNGRARSSQVYTYLAGHVGRMGEQGAVRSILTQLVMWAEWESKEQLGLYLPSWSCGPNGRARSSQVYTYLAGHVGRMGEQGAVRSILTQLVMWAEWESKEQLGLYLPSWSCGPNGRARSSQVYTYLAGHVGRMGEQGAVRSILTQLVMWAEWESKEQLGLYLPSWSCGPNGRARSSQVYTYLAGHVGRMGEQGAVRSILTQLVMWAEWESKEQLGLYLPSWSCGPNGRARSSQVYTYLAGHVGRMGEQGAVRSILTQLVMWAEWESKEQLGLYLPSWSCGPNGRARSSQVYTYLAGHVGRMGEQGAVRSILTQLVMWTEWESKEQLGLYLPSWSCGPNGRARSSQVYTYLAGHVGRMGEQGAVRSILTQLVMWAEWESKEQLGLYLPSWSCGPNGRARSSQVYTYLAGHVGRMGEQGAVRSILTQLVMWAEWESKEQLGLYLPSWSCGPNGRARSSQVYTYLAGHVDRMGEQGAVRSILTQLVMWTEWESKEQLGLYLPSWSCGPNGRARSSQVYTYLAGHVGRMGEQGAVRSILTQLVVWAEWESKEQLGLYLPSWSCGPNGRARSSQVYTYLAGHVGRMGEQGAVRSILTQLVMWAEWESKEQLGLYLPSWSCGPNGRARSSQVYTYLAGHVGRMGGQGAVRSILTQLVMWAEWESKEQLGLYLPSWSCGPNGRARSSQVYTYLAGHVDRMGEQGAVRSILTQLVMWAEWEGKEQLGLYLPSWSCGPNGRARSSQVYTYLAGHVGRMGEQGAVRSILTQLVMWAEWESKEQLGLYLPSWSCGPNGRARSSQVYTYLAGHVGRMGEQGAVRSILTQLVMWAEWESKEQLGLYLPSWSCGPNGRARSSQVYTYLAGHVGRMGEQGAVRSILTQLVMWAEWESKEQLGLYLPSWSCGPNGRARSSQVYTYLAGHVGRMGEQGAVRSILTQLVMWAEWESKEQLGLYLPSWSCGNGRARSSQVYTYLAGHVGRMGEQGAVRSILTQLVMWAEWESKEQLGLYLPSWSCGPNGRARSSQVYTYLAGHVGRMGEQGAVRSILTQLVMWAEWESKEQLGLYLPSWSCGPNGRARSSQVYTYLAGHVGRMGEQGAVRSILTQLVMWAEWESKEQLGLYLPSWSCGPNGRARSSQVYTYLAGHVGRMGEQGAVRSILTQLVMWAEWESKEQLGLYLPSWSCVPNGRARNSQWLTGGYTHWASGLLQQLEVNTNNPNFCHVWIAMKPSASCTHVSAALHALCALKPTTFDLKPNLPPAINSSDYANTEVSVTSLPCRWKPPRKRKESTLRVSDATL